MLPAPESHNDHDDIDNQNIEYFDAADYAIGLIQRAVVNKQNVWIHGGPVGSIYVLPEKGEYISMVKDNEEFFSKSAEELQVHVLDSIKLKELDAESKTRLKLNDLLWLAAHIPAKGRLMKGCQPYDVIQLNRLPNLTRLPHTPNAMRLATQFSSIPTSVYIASRILEVPQWEINEFYSAARAAGWAEVVNRRANQANEALKPHRNRTMLEKVFNRLSNLS